MARWLVIFTKGPTCKVPPTHSHNMLMLWQTLASWQHKNGFRAYPDHMHACKAHAYIEQSAKWFILNAALASTHASQPTHWLQNSLVLHVRVVRQIQGVPGSALLWHRVFCFSHSQKRESGRVVNIVLFCFVFFSTQHSDASCEFSFLLRAVFIESLVCVLGRASLFPRQIEINTGQHLDAGVPWSRLNFFVVV